MNQDHYKILEIDKGATDVEIKKAYRKLSRLHHPDLNTGDKGAEERYKKITFAYEILSNPVSRSKFDRDHPRQPRDTNQTRSRASSSTNEQTARTPPPRKPSKGATVTAKETLTISLKEGLLGCEKKILVQGPTKKYRVTIKLKPSAEVTNRRVTLQGAGSPSSSGGVAGDLLVKVAIQNDRHYSLSDNKDLLLTLQVSPIEAALGLSVTTRHLLGEIVTIQLPKGIKNNRKIVVRNQGLPAKLIGNKSKNSNLIVTVKIRTGFKISQKSKDLVKQLEFELFGSAMRSDYEG